MFTNLGKTFRGEYIMAAEVTRFLASIADKIYRRSLQQIGSGHACLVKINAEKALLFVDARDWSGYGDFKGEEKLIHGKNVKVASLDHENACALRYWFPYTAPLPLGNKGSSIGLGDRLGIATPGHIWAVENKQVRPVFAQQSARELQLTDRNFADVLDAATWAVFQENYKEGFGADGDHLKKASDIKSALDAGFTMITLDCSEELDNTVWIQSPAEIENAYQKLDKEVTTGLEDFYLDKEFLLGNYRVSFNEQEFKKIVLTYLPAIDFINYIYNNLIRHRNIDFEISIDETNVPTSPQAHFFTASEIQRRGIKITSLAPRFCGEFQKGIDYIGDLQEFERQFQVHAAIADFFGYKLSIHSGSDKFKVFPIIGKLAKDQVHLKTAGTSWLEALKLIAKFQPELFHVIYQQAWNHLQEARKYYVVNLNSEKIPEPKALKIGEEEAVLTQDDTRQLLHISYGFLLNQENLTLRNEIYSILERYEEEYWTMLKHHLGRHIQVVMLQES